MAKYQDNNSFTNKHSLSLNELPYFHKYSSIKKIIDKKEMRFN